MPLYLQRCTRQAEFFFSVSLVCTTRKKHSPVGRAMENYYETEFVIQIKWFWFKPCKIPGQKVWKIILTCTLLGKQSKKIFAFQLLPKPRSIKIHTKQKKVRLSKSNETAKIFLRWLGKMWSLLCTIVIISIRQLLSCWQTLDGTLEFCSSHTKFQSTHFREEVWDVKVGYCWL